MAATTASLLSPRPASLGFTTAARRPARAAPPLRREGRGAIQAHAALGTALDLGGSPSGLSQLATSLATTLAWAAAGYMLLQNLRLQTEEVDKQGKKECDSCEGTGLQECWCTRLPGAAGCSSCGGSGKSRCNSCGGGGSAVVATSKLYISPERRTKNF